MNSTVPRLWYWLSFLPPPVFWSDLCPKSYVFKDHVSNVIIYLCHYIYLFCSVHEPFYIFSNCVPKAQWTFKPFHESQKLVSVLVKYQKYFFLKRLFRLLSLDLWNILSLLFPPSGLRNLLLKFSPVGGNDWPHWTQVSSPKPQTSYESLCKWIINSWMDWRIWCFFWNLEVCVVSRSLCTVLRNCRDEGESYFWKRANLYTPHKSGREICRIIVEGPTFMAILNPV